MLTWIVAALALYVVQTFLPPVFKYFLGEGSLGPNVMDALSGRDAPPPMSAVGARAERALGNMQEALFVFLPFAVIAHIQGADTVAWYGAAFWVGMRTLYIPAYLSGIPGVRTGIWTLSWIGLGAVVWSVIQPALLG